jgi:hypothetical protein
MLHHIWIVSGSNLGPETAQQHVTGGTPRTLQRQMSEQLPLVQIWRL